MTALTRLASLLGLFDTIPFSNRNYIVDGNWDSWLIPVNGSVVLPSNTPTISAATMYWISSGVGGGATISRNQFPPNGWQPGMTTPVWNTLTYNQTTASTGAPGQILQRIESVYTLAGKSATFSCWLWTASGTAIITSITSTQVFGTGGSPSAGVGTTTNVNWVVTTTPKRFSVRLDIPVISGMTLGTNNNDFIQVAVNMPAAGTYFIGTAQWQLEQSSPLSSSDLNGKGGLPTAFEYRGQQAEAARVSRHYQALGPQFIGGYAAAGNTVYLDWPFVGLMRGVPSVAASSAFTYSNASGAAVSGILGGQAVRMQVNITAAGYGFVYGGNWIADARL